MCRPCREKTGNSELVHHLFLKIGVCVVGKGAHLVNTEILQEVLIFYSQHSGMWEYIRKSIKGNRMTEGFLHPFNPSLMGRRTFIRRWFLFLSRFNYF